MLKAHTIYVDYDKDLGWFARVEIMSKIRDMNFKGRIENTYSSSTLSEAIDKIIILINNLGIEIMEEMFTIVYLHKISEPEETDEIPETLIETIEIENKRLKMLI